MSVVIWNPNAGQRLRGPGSGASREDLSAALDRHGVHAEVVATESADDVPAAVRKAVGAGHELIVAAGGDGTIAQIATELLGSNVVLGMLPLGSVMNIPRMLGVPRDLEGAAEIVAAGRARVVDVGEANRSVFYETASVGLNAAMFSAAQHFEDGDYGSVARSLYLAFRYRPARIRIELDDRPVTTRALMVTVSNGAYMGVGMTIAPEARLDDGRFDVRVFRHFSKLELLRHLVSIAFGRRRYTPHLDTYRSARVVVTSRRPLPCRADSRDLGTTPLECSVRRAALRVLVGPDFAAGKVASD